MTMTVDYLGDATISELENKRYDLLQQFFYLMEQQYIIGVEDQNEHNENVSKLHQIYGAIIALDEMIANITDDEYTNVVTQLITY